MRKCGHRSGGGDACGVGHAGGVDLAATSHRFTDADAGLTAFASRIGEIWRLTFGPSEPACSAVTAPARRLSSIPPRCQPWPVLVLLVLLAGGGATADAAPDPMAEAVQRALVERGFDPGKIDGAMGRRTRNALRAFQRSVGLPESGEIGPATVTALGLEAPGPGQMPAPADAPPSGAADDQPEPVPADPSGSGTAGAGTTTAPDAGTPSTEPPRAEPEPKPTPKPAAKPLLSFMTLGWHRPQTGAAALERFTAIGASPDFERGAGSLFVPKSEFVFVLQAEERIPGLDCDPGAGRLSIEFVFGPNGPVIFTPAAGEEYCRMGIGIALAVGGTLEMRRIDWGGVQYPPGAVRITNQGIEYVK